MSTTTDVELSRKYSLYHRDGLLDIFMGLGVLLAGAALWADMAWMAGVWVAIFVPLWISARKTITYQRVPEADLSPDDNRRYQLVLSVAVGLLVLGVLTGLFFALGFAQPSALRSFLDRYIHLLMGAGLAGFLMLVAAVLHLPRYYAYAALTALIYIIGHFTGWQFWISMSLAGGLVSLSGFVVLGRFLWAHPVAE